MDFPGFASGRRPDRTRRRFPIPTVLASALLLAGSSTARAQQPWAEGTWSTSYDWFCDARDAAPTNTPLHLMNAALVAHGPYRGSIVLWVRSVYINVPPDTYFSRTLLWHPETPHRLVHIPSVHAPFTSDVLGATLAQDDEGQIVLAGAGSVGSTYKETRRFLPGALSVPIVWEPPGTQFPCGGETPFIRGAAWQPNLDMSMGRWESTLVALSAKKILAPQPFGWIPAASTLVLGGSATESASVGIEFLQALTPRSTPGGSSWSHTLVPNPTTLPASPNTPPTPNEQYEPRGGLTEVRLDSTPCAVQLRTVSQGGTEWTRTVFVGQDSNTGYGSPLDRSNTPGRSWVVRPRFDSGSPTAPATWEMWPGVAQSGDRSRGTLALRHDLNGQFGHTGKNRLLSVGGIAHGSGPGGGWAVQGTVSEYNPGNDPSAGGWAAKPTAALAGRMDNNVVLLPTGDLLLVGGSQTIDPITVAPGNVAFQPQLFRPGVAGALSGWSVSNLAMPPIPAGFTTAYPRLRHSLAVLLADGRVMVGGGSVVVPGSPDGRFTGEVYSPPYLHQGFRPSIAAISNVDIPFATNFKVDVLRSADETVERVVLLRPASLAHHFDSSQRYIELEFTPGAYSQGIQALDVVAPADDLGPPGYYMLHVLTRHDCSPPPDPGVPCDASVLVPSVAQYVRLIP